MPQTVKRPLDQLEDLRLLRRELQVLCKNHLPALTKFHPTDDLTKVKSQQIKVRAFSHLWPNDADKEALQKGNKISIASTVTCIKSLAHAPDFAPVDNISYSEFLAALEKARVGKKLISSGLENKNPFTVGLLLPILKHTHPDQTNHPVVQECLASAAMHVKGDGVSMTDYPANGYLTYWTLVGLQEWASYAPEVAKPSLDWSEREFYRQIALFECGAEEESDAFQLGYNFLIQFRFRKRNLKPDIISLALRTLFAAQLERGVWEKKDPLFVYGNTGDAYCFSFELLTALLSEMWGDEGLDALKECEPGLTNAVRWAQRNQHDEPSVPVWRTGHRVNEERPESWATAEVYLYLQLYRSLLTGWIQSLLLTHFRGTPRSPIQLDEFAKFYQPLVKLPREQNREIPLAELLKERIIDPLLIEDEYSLVRQPDPKQCLRSGILFGPPGTGKTTYVRAIAKHLGWPLVILDPSDFAKEGMHLITNTTARVFDLLLEFEDTVIFFDEMEELIRKRDTGESSFEQRFLTTSLLPKLQLLSDKATCLFFVATNHFNTIDDAARREGRFDFQLLVTPPSVAEKVRMITDRWAPTALPPAIQAEFDRPEHAEKLLWASRTETVALIEQIWRNPGNVRALLVALAPTLMHSDKYKQYLDEIEFNGFSRAIPLAVN